MKELTRYAEKRFRLLRAALKDFGKSKDPELLHKARVEIKRIKTILNLMAFQDPKFDAHKTYIPLRTIFRACFSVREPQVMNQLSGKISGIKNGVDEEYEQNVKKFESKIPKYLRIVKSQKKLMMKKIEDITNKEYLKYTQERKQTLSKKLYPSLEVEELHKTRKLVKEIIFLEEIGLPKSKRDPFYPQTAKTLGDWHDGVVLLEKLRKERPKKLDPIKKLQQKNRSALANLRAAVKEYYSNINR